MMIFRMGGGGSYYNIICDKWRFPAELHGEVLTLTPYVYRIYHHYSYFQQ